VEQNRLGRGLPTTGVGNLGRLHRGIYFRPIPFAASDGSWNRIFWVPRSTGVVRDSYPHRTKELRVVRYPVGIDRFSTAQIEDIC
jgi:hypothetical protein